MIRNMTEDAYQRIKHIAEPSNKVGAPFRKPMEDRAKAIMVQVFFGVSDRVAEGLLVLFKDANVYFHTSLCGKLNGISD